jgi:hypothetical protein
MKRRSALIVAGLGLVVGAAFLFLTGFVRASGTAGLIVVPDPTLVRPRGYCVLNPFRSRGPEQAAEGVLAQLQGSGPEILKPLLTGCPGDPCRHVLEAERRYPIEAWRIGDRRDEADGVWLMYWVRRGGGYAEPGYEEEVRFSVRQVGSGWAVEQFGAVY